MDVRGTVLTIISVTVGVILCGSVLIPISVDVVGDLNDDPETKQWGTLISLTVTLTILGIVVAALYMYTSSK